MIVAYLVITRVSMQLKKMCRVVINRVSNFF